MPDKSHLTIAETETIEEAFQRLNANKLGILFARDAEGRVIGAVTDGDIRRRLLTGISIQGELASCINRNFVWARAGAPREQILKLLDQRVHVVPILDADGRLVDVFSRDLFNLGQESEVFARARSPVRISFSGGGTDLTHYFVDNDGGSVINATIAMYAHATLRRRADNKVRIYSHDFRCTVEAENLAALGTEGELALIKSVIRLIKPAYGFDLEVSADFPIGSGLGGSAVVSSAIIGCFNEFRSDRWDRHEIAEMAAEAEASNAQHSRRLAGPIRHRVRRLQSHGVLIGAKHDRPASPRTQYCRRTRGEPRALLHRLQPVTSGSIHHDGEKPARNQRGCCSRRTGKRK